LNNTVSTNFVFCLLKQNIYKDTYCFVAQASETVKSGPAKTGLAGPVATALFETIEKLYTLY